MKGIYLIENKLTNEKYIGQSKNIQKRWESHRSSMKNSKYNLHSDMRFYGLDQFEFTVLEETDNLDERENYWIKHYLDNGHKLYNIKGVPIREASYRVRRRSKRSFKTHRT